MAAPSTRCNLPMVASCITAAAPMGTAGIALIYGKPNCILINCWRDELSTCCHLWFDVAVRDVDRNDLPNSVYIGWSVVGPHAVSTSPLPTGNGLPAFKKRNPQASSLLRSSARLPTRQVVTRTAARDTSRSTAHDPWNSCMPGKRRPDCSAPSDHRELSARHDPALVSGLDPHRSKRSGNSRQGGSDHARCVV